MTKEFLVYDAVTGLNTRYSTKEEALMAFWKNVVFVARMNFHNTAYMVIEKNENGTERWYNDQNQEIDRPMTPEEIEAIIKNIIESEQSQT